MKPLKVLMLLHDLSRTGAPKVALDLIESLGERVETRFIAAEPGPLDERCRRLGTFLQPFAALPRGRLAWRLESRRRRREWDQQVLQWKPDLIYANSVMSLPLADRIDRSLGLPDAPMLLHVHELDSVLAQARERYQAWLVGRPACYVGVSKAVCSSLVEFAGVDAAKVRFVPAFVRESEFASISAPPRSEGRLVVGGAGIPSWRKNTTLWLQAAVAFRADARVRFLWVGVPEGPAGQSFRVKCRRLGLENHADVLPVTERPLEAFAAFDIYLMTSWEDPFPLVVLENMMLQKPVVCLPGGGAPDQVGDTGIVVTEFDPQAVAEAVRALIADPERRRRLGAAARQRVLDNFTDRACVPMLWEAMQQTAARS